MPKENTSDFIGEAERINAAFQDGTDAQRYIAGFFSTALLDCEHYVVDVPKTILWEVEGRLGGIAVMLGRYAKDAV